MSEVFLAWFGFTGSIVTIGACLDVWLEESARAQLSATLNARLKDPAKWFHSVETAFTTIFDYVYGWRRSDLNRLVWRAILFSYLILILARIVLWGFRIPVPQMEKILVVAFIVAIGLTMMLQAGLAAVRLTEAHRNTPLRMLVRNREFVSTVAISSFAVAYYTFAAILTGHAMGVSLKNVAAIAFGAGLGIPTVILVTRVKDSVIAVSPLRAIASSLLFVVLLAVLFPSAARSFISELERTGPFILATIAFNIFGDAVSLVETRWMLRLSRGLPVLGIVVMLVLDVVLSGIIYLVLPGISGVDWSTLISAIQFQGPMPWMGILFWSTFLTSLLFYLFVASILLLRILASLTRLVNRLDRWFSIYQHPVRLVTIAMVMLETFGFVIWGLYR